MELQDLCGEHMLDAVDFSTEQFDSYGDGSFENAEVIRFRLNGVVYTATEDPKDGYRSCMRELVVSNAEMTNSFQPMRVIGRHRTTGRYDCDILELIDAVTGRIVLEVGTENTDDYYPGFVAAFHPEAMSINQDAEARG